MDIQQQNYLFVNAMQRWFLFFYQIYRNSFHQIYNK